MPGLVFEEQVLVSVAVAQARAERRRGPMGREASDGTVLLRPARSVRTVGMRSVVDGAHLGRDLQVLRTATMARSRIGMQVPTVGAAVEAPAGLVGPPGLSQGDELEVRL